LHALADPSYHRGSYSQQRFSRASRSRWIYWRGYSRCHALRCGARAFFQ